MASKAKKYFLYYFFPLVLILAVLFLCIQNYVPGTFLSGWDTLHPEFNFPLNFKRILFGVWREEQGVGALAAHSHMSELPRLIFLWLSSLIFSTNFLRYFYFFITLFIGPLGVYFFINYALSKRHDNLRSQIVVFCGALYYLLNLGTLGHFYVPFEMFATQYAFLPWIFLFALKYVKKGKKRALLILFVVSFLASPQAYAATLFYSLFLGLSIFTILFALLSRNKRYIKRALISLILVILANSFWLLPNLYFVAKSNETVKNSQINMLFSPEAHLVNEQYGNLKNTLIHKSFLFSWREYSDATGEFVYLLDEWIDHINGQMALFSLYVVSSIVIFGALISIFKKEKESISVLAVFLFSLFFLINNNPPTGELYSLIINSSETIKEALRMPFTKFSIIFMFASSYFFALFINFFINLTKKIKPLWLKHLFLLSTVLASSFLIVFPMLPAFKGNLISSSMKINIPNEYFEMQEWFDNNPEGRIAKFPVNTPQGWIYYNWGYEGAGFNWFGIKNPNFDRDFDRWSAYNESFYNEVSSSLYSEDWNRFEEVLKKYNVAYLLLDESIINPGGGSGVLYIDKLEDALLNIKSVIKEKEFGFLKIYKTNFKDDPVRSPGEIFKINADSIYSEYDWIYHKFGDYINDNRGTIYPFVNFDKRSKNKISVDKDFIYFDSAEYSKNFKNLIFPEYLRESGIPLLVSLDLSGKILNIQMSFASPEVLSESGWIKLYEILLRDRFEVKDQLSFVSINNKIFELGNGTNIDFLLDQSEELSIKYYQLTPHRKTKLESDLISSDNRLCGDPEIVLPALTTTDKKLVFPESKEAICRGAGFEVENSVLSIDFTSSGERKIWPCISKIGGEGCLNKAEDKLVSLDKGNYWISFVAEPSSESTANEVVNLAINEYKLVKNSTYDIQEIFSPYLNEKSVRGVVNPIRLRIPKIGIIKETFDQGRGYKNAFNCDLFKLGKVYKRALFEGFLYKAEDSGVSCDYLDYPVLDTNKSYLFHLAGENFQGRSLKIYLHNPVTNRMDLERLMSNGSFDEIFLVNSKKYDQPKGYNLNIETRAFGRIASENLLKEVEFIPINIAWLTDIRTEDPEKFSNDIEIVSWEKINPVFYKAEVSGEGIVALSQGYDEGWIAFDKKFTVFKHLKFNNWANAWEVPQGEYTIYIFYWPQLLQFIGFASLLFVASYLILKR